MQDIARTCKNFQNVLKNLLECTPSCMILLFLLFLVQYYVISKKFDLVYEVKSCGVAIN